MVDILIVDDNPLTIKLLDYLLTGKGYEISSALNAEEALKSLEKSLPKLILMDLQLPGIDGLALTRKLKSNPSYQHISIIAITAYAMKGDREKALAAGCDDYIAKPIDIRILPGIIANQLQGHKKT